MARLMLIIYHLKTRMQSYVTAIVRYYVMLFAMLQEIFAFSLVLTIDGKPTHSEQLPLIF
jgi:hypothetical protein